MDDPQYGWTKLIRFGSTFGKDSLPRLQRLTHFVSPGPEGIYGYDGQFYAQLALDPSLRDSGFDKALDNPAYRARRIGLPACAFMLGWGKPRRVLQAYALSNLIFWFLLVGALSYLARPWKRQQLLCLAAGALSYGVIASMESSLVDLPAAAMLFTGMAIGSWGGYAAFAAAILTRETSLLAAIGSLDFRRKFDAGTWCRQLALLAAAVLPFAGWMLYVHQHLAAENGAAGVGNFSWPLQALAARYLEAVRLCPAHVGDGLAETAGPLLWTYTSNTLHEVLTIMGLGAQVAYLTLRPAGRSPLWRTAVCYAALWAVLGPAVWEGTGAAARVLLPMTICFYLLLARESAGWFFWPFFILGSVSIPYGLHDFWYLS